MISGHPQRREDNHPTTHRALTRAEACTAAAAHATVVALCYLSVAVPAAAAPVTCAALPATTLRAETGTKRLKMEASASAALFARADTPAVAGVAVPAHVCTASSSSITLLSLSAALAAPAPCLPRFTSHALRHLPPNPAAHAAGITTKSADANDKAAMML
jgi:hypothetical protein